jgi:hypothetical protein
MFDPDALLTDHRVVAKYKGLWRSEPCVYCGRVPPSKRGVGCNTREHLVPRSFGGGQEWTNIVGACDDCNQLRGLMPLLHFLLYKHLQRMCIISNSNKERRACGFFVCASERAAYEARNLRVRVE